MAKGFDAGSAFLGGIVTALIDEGIFVGPRVNRARYLGYNQGLWDEYNKLNPTIVRLTAENGQQRTVIGNQRVEIGLLKGENDRLNKKISMLETELKGKEKKLSMTDKLSYEVVKA